MCEACSQYYQGLAKCGNTIAYGVAQTGLGDSLLLAVRTLTPDGLRVFLNIWRNTLRNVLKNGSLGRKHPAVAAQVTDAFPNLEVLDLYINPVTSWSFGGAGVNSSHWVPKSPHIPSITRFCQESFSWGNAAQLPTKLFNVLLPSLCLHHLSEVSSNCQCHSGVLICCSSDSQ